MICPELKYSALRVGSNSLYTNLRTMIRDKNQLKQYLVDHIFLCRRSLLRRLKLAYNIFRLNLGWLDFLLLPE